MTWLNLYDLCKTTNRCDAMIVSIIIWISIIISGIYIVRAWRKLLNEK